MCLAAGVLMITLGLSSVSAQVDEHGIPEGPFSNGGFERGLSGWKWMISLNADADCVVDADVSHGGQKSVRMSNNTPQKAHTYGVLRRRVTGLEPDGMYRIVAWIKAEDLGKGMIGGGPNWDYVYKFPTGTYGWTRIYKDIAPKGEDNFELVITISDVTEAFWIDDIQFIERSEATHVELTPMVLRAPSAFDQERGVAWLTIDHPEYTNGEWLSGNFGIPGPVNAGTEYELVATHTGGKELLLDTFTPAGSIPEDESAQVGFAVKMDALPKDGEWTLSVRTASDATELAKAGFTYTDLNRLLKELTADLKPQREALDQKLLASPAMAEDDYVKVWLSIADYYTDRLERKKSYSAWWGCLQARQVGRIYEQIENWIESEQPLEWPKRELAMVPVVSMRFTETELLAQREGEDEEIPFYAMGYGHFFQVSKDVPLLAGWGIDALAKGSGPERGSMTPDRELGGKDTKVWDSLRAIDVAAEHDVFVDFMIGTHGVADWFKKEYPDAMINNPGFIDIDIDHPSARRMVEDWIIALMPELMERPNVVSVGVSNEPQYIRSGHTIYSREKYTQFLRDRYGSIQNLNTMYETSYDTFSEVPLPGMDAFDNIGRKRASFDWLEFNSMNFAEWHGWVSDMVHDFDPDMPTYSKLVDMQWNASALRSGIDPELICGVTDLAGCDNHAYPTPDGEFIMDWHSQEIWYDLLHSFYGQPVINTENHIIPNGLREEIPGKHVRAALWQGALHRNVFTTMWIWDLPQNHWHFEGSIYLRPLVLAEAQRTMLDARRLAEEMTILVDAPKRVAILYSTPSLFWDDEHYGETAERIHMSLLLRGYVPTFISERQLAEGQADRFDAIILPNSGHVRQSAIDALGEYVDAGGELVVFGHVPNRNEYDLPLEMPASLESLGVNVAQTDDQKLADQLVEILSGVGLTTPALTDTVSGKPAWGVEYRTVETNEGTYVAIINFNHEPVTVNLDVQGKAVNLVDGQSVNLRAIELVPLEPHLLRVTE